MYPSSFLKITGGILIVLAILGLLGILGPTPEKSHFKETLFLDTAQAALFILTGIIALMTAFYYPQPAKTFVTLSIGILAFIIGIFSLTHTQQFFSGTVEYPSETVFFLLLGAWALFSVFGSPKKIQEA